MTEGWRFSSDLAAGGQPIKAPANPLISTTSLRPATPSKHCDDLYSRLTAPIPDNHPVHASGDSIQHARSTGTRASGPLHPLPPRPSIHHRRIPHLHQYTFAAIEAAEQRSCHRAG